MMDIHLIKPLLIFVAPHPRGQINNMELHFSRFLSASEEDQIIALHSVTRTWHIIPELIGNLLKRRYERMCQWHPLLFPD